MIHRSIIFAATAHNNQLRKGTPLPYIIHPMEVAQILSYIHASQTVIVSGILHDTLEDTSVSYENLVSFFGIEIANLVLECSNFSPGSWKTRKSHTVAKLRKTKNHEVALILCADKLSNLRSIVFDSKTSGHMLWERFSAPQSNILWYYGELKAAIEQRHDLPYCLVEEFCKLYQELLDISI